MPGTHGYAAQGREGHLERLLRVVQAHTTLDVAQSRVRDQLQFVATHYRQRMLLVVVADEAELTDTDVNLVRRFHAQHEILWITVEDADPTAAGYGTVPSTWGRRSSSRQRCGSTPACTTPTPPPSPPGARPWPRRWKGSASSTPASAPATGCWGPSSGCWRGSAAVAADFYSPMTYSPVWLYLGVVILMAIAGWAVVIWARPAPVVRRAHPSRRRDGG